MRIRREDAEADRLAQPELGDGGVVACVGEVRQLRRTTVAEVVLGELAGQPLEAAHERRLRRPDPADELVERGLAAAVAALLRAPKQLAGRQLRILVEPLLDVFPERLCRWSRSRRIPESPHCEMYAGATPAADASPA